MTYSEQMQSPLWQQKRLLIMQRDNWKCTECGNDKIQLQVHHTEYIKGRLAWNYEDSLLKTLCSTCHKKKHGINDAPAHHFHWDEVNHPEILPITKLINHLQKKIKEVNDDYLKAMPLLAEFSELIKKRTRLYRGIYGT